jgi:hypothetical protein
MQAGLPNFTLSASEWIEKTNAIGIIVKKGRYGGTYAFKDIADGTKRDFDELYIERNSAGLYWIHFTVCPRVNRRKLGFLKA